MASAGAGVQKEIASVLLTISPVGTGVGL